MQLTKKEIAALIHRLKNGQATDRDEKMLEEYWQHALKDTSYLDNMPADSREKLKNEIFNSIEARIGLKSNSPHRSTKKAHKGSR